MNKTFKVIFNKTKGKYIAVNELKTTSRKRKLVAASIAVSSIMLSSLNAAIAANDPLVNETEAYVTEGNYDLSQEEYDTLNAIYINGDAVFNLNHAQTIFSDLGLISIYGNSLTFNGQNTSNTRIQINHKITDPSVGNLTIDNSGSINLGNISEFSVSTEVGKFSSPPDDPTTALMMGGNSSLKQLSHGNSINFSVSADELVGTAYAVALIPYTHSETSLDAQCVNLKAGIKSAGNGGVAALYFDGTDEKTISTFSNTGIITLTASAKNHRSNTGLLPLDGLRIETNNWSKSKLEVKAQQLVVSTSIDSNDSSVKITGIHSGINSDLTIDAPTNIDVSASNLNITGASGSDLSAAIGVEGLSNANISFKKTLDISVAGGEPNTYGIKTGGTGSLQLLDSSKISVSGKSQVCAVSLGSTPLKSSPNSFTAHNLTITASTASQAEKAYGIVAPGNANGQSQVQLQGTTTIEADEALKGGGKITTSGDFSLVGSTLVGSDFTGDFIINGGTTTLTSANGFFADGASVTINNGGTLEAETITGSAQVSVQDGGTLRTTSDQIFQTALNGDGTGTDSSTVAANNINFNEGATLSLTDDYFNLGYVRSALDQLGANGPALIMEGQLITDEANNGASVSLLANQNYGQALLYTDLTNENKDLAVGTDTVPDGWDADTTVTHAEDLSAKKLDLGTGSKILVTGGKTLTLNGDGTNVVTNTSGIVTVTVGTDEQNGTLSLGHAAAGLGGTLSGSVNLTQKGSLNVISGNYVLEMLDNQGDVTVKDGGILQIQKSGTHSGTLTIEDTTESAKSLAAYIQDEAQVRDAVTLGKNSMLILGGKLADAQSALNGIDGKSWGTDITSLTYVQKTANVYATINATNGNAGVMINRGGMLMIDAGALGGDAAINYVGEDKNAVFTLADGSMLFVRNAQAGSNVLVASGFDDYNAQGEILTANRLIAGSAATADNGLLVSFEQKHASEELSGLLIPNVVDDAVLNSGTTGGKRINDLLTSGVSDAQIVKELNSIALMGTAGAAQVASVNVSGVISDTIDQHGSKLATYSHGEAGADLWVTLNGSFSRAEGYSAGDATYGYRSDIAGLTVGADYAFANGMAAGLALSAGTGSVRGNGDGAGVKNEMDYVGVNLYGVWSTKFANLIGTIGYMNAQNEISRGAFKGKPDVQTISAGLRAEFPIAMTESSAVTPHIGIRYLNIDMDDFTTGGITYGAETANIFEIPVGLAFTGDYRTACGSLIKPFLDLQLTPVFGDKKTTQRVALEGGMAADSFEARIAASELYSARFGLEAAVENHSLNVSYGVGIGAHSRVDQALQAKYRYAF